MNKERIFFRDLSKVGDYTKEGKRTGMYLIPMLYDGEFADFVYVETIETAEDCIDLWLGRWKFAKVKQLPIEMNLGNRNIVIQERGKFLMHDGKYIESVTQNDKCEMKINYSLTKPDYEIVRGYEDREYS